MSLMQTHEWRELAHAILTDQHLQVRAIMQQWLATHPILAELPQPHLIPEELAVVAGIIELVADRLGQSAPAWTAAIGGLPEPFFVVPRARRPGFSRDLSLSSSPPPLARRNLFAPPNYLMMV